MTTEDVETHAMPTPRAVNLHEDGLLWLINRCVFHPRGFALAHIRDTDEWSLLGDGTDVWAFPYDSEDESFAAATACFERIRAFAEAK